MATRRRPAGGSRPSASGSVIAVPVGRVELLVSVCQTLAPGPLSSAREVNVPVPG